MDHHPCQILFFLSISFSLLLSISAFRFLESTPSPAPVPSPIPWDKCSSPPETSNSRFSASQFNNNRAPNKVHREVRNICNATDYPEICITTIVPFLKDKIDVLSVLKIAIEVGTRATELTLSRAKKLATKPGTPPVVVSILNDCKEFYDTALYNYEEAMNALPVRDIGTMNIMLSAVITDIGDCEDAFSGEKSPLLKLGDRVTKMTSNCLAIVGQIH